MLFHWTRANRIVWAAVICLAAASRSPCAETADDKVIRTGSGLISDKMTAAATAVIDIDGVPSTLVPGGYTGLLFFVTGDPAAPDASALLLVGRTAKGELKAVARLEFTEAFEGKGTGGFAEGALVLIMEYPYSTAVHETRWSWDGKAAKPLGSKEYDPQKGIAEGIRGLIKKGDLAAAIKEVQGVLYPDSYLNAGEIGPLLLQLGHKKALVEYRAGKPDSAAKLLSDVFLTDQAALLLGMKSRDQYGKAGCAAYLPFDEFIVILNDYGFFLEQSSDPRAVEILSIAVALDPERTVAFLNLADALWGEGRKTEAAVNYREYARLMKAKGFEKQIPSRVTERSKG
jgi:hypothetical protein